MGDKNVISDVASDRALRVSEERYRRLFEAARDGILILDADTGRIVDVNPFLTVLTGYSREEFLDKALWEIGPFKDAGASKTSFVRLQEQEYIRYDDLPLKTRAGGTVDVEFVSNVYLVGDWRVIQCNVRDISARKRADAERQLLTTAIEQSVDTVIITDAHGSMLYVNPAFERVSGYSRTEALGTTPGLLKSGAQDGAFYRALWETVTSGKTWSGRFVNKRKDGSLYSEDATISPVRNSAGAVTHFVGVQRDVTEYPLHAPRLSRVARWSQSAGHGGRGNVGASGGGVARERADVAGVQRGSGVHGGRSSALGAPSRQDAEAGA